MNPTLRIAVADYDRVKGLVDGSITSDRFEIEATTLAPSEIFYRQLHDGEFDVSEMSMSSYLIAREEGWNYTAIPVFPNRRLFHLNTWTTADGPHPEELTNPRFGLTEFQVTAAVWTRGVLHSDFGLDLSKVSWFVERTPELSHGGETGFAPASGLSVTQMDAEDTLLDAMVRGDLDLLLPSPYPGMASRLNRTDEQELEGNNAFRPLFVDPRGEARRFVLEHGFLPMNHTVVIRDSLLAENPGLAREVFDLFSRAKQQALANLASLRRSHVVLGSVYLTEERELFGADPYPYGFAANQRALDTLVGHLLHQGLLTQPVDVETVFDSSVIDS